MSSVALPPASPSAPVIAGFVSPPAARVAPDDLATTAFFDASASLPTGHPLLDVLGQAAMPPADSELMACLHMHQGVLVGAFAMDLAKIRVRLMQSAVEVVRVSGLTVQDVARCSMQATGSWVAQSAATAGVLAKQAAWSTGEACVLGAWSLSTWPMRTLYRAAFAAKAPAALATSPT